MNSPWQYLQDLKRQADLARDLVLAAMVIIAAFALVEFGGGPDPDQTQATADSVTALGQELRAKHEAVLRELTRQPAPTSAEVEQAAARLRMSYPLQPMQQLEADANFRKQQKH